MVVVAVVNAEGAFSLDGTLLLKLLPPPTPLSALSWRRRRLLLLLRGVLFSTIITILRFFMGRFGLGVLIIFVEEHDVGDDD